jgi:tellurite resistance protein TehA-like permease
VDIVTAAKPRTADVRLNLFVRVLGLAFLGLGVTLATYTATAPLLAQVASVFYLVAGLLGIAGLIALIARFEKPETSKL